jgi:hypothetical protein
MVDGYVLCKCNAWVRDEVASVTRGRCPACFQADGAERVVAIELVGRGMRVQVPLGGRRTKKRALTEGRIERRKRNERAKLRARKRLAMMFPDLFATLVAEERGALGLDPWPVETAVATIDPDAELGFAELLSELETRGVDTA